MAAEVADQRKVSGVLEILHRSGNPGSLLQGRPRALGYRKVVVNAGNGLHPRAVTVRQSRAIDCLRAADVGASEAADWNVLVRGQGAGHARTPKRFVADMPANELMDLAQLVQTAVHLGVYTGDQLELRFAEVGGDMRMGQRRTERHWMG